MGDFVLPLPIKGERVISDGGSATTQSMPPSPSEPSPGLDADEGLDDEPPLEKSAYVEDDDAVSALLSLQKDQTPPPSAQGGGFTLSRTSVSSSGPQKLGGISKNDGAMRFYCRFPSCGKGYASTDAVRKHCRQRHLEWLRHLGAGCPALYCRWEGGGLS